MELLVGSGPTARRLLLILASKNVYYLPTHDVHGVDLTPEQHVTGPLAAPHNVHMENV